MRRVLFPLLLVCFCFGGTGSALSQSDPQDQDTTTETQDQPLPAYLEELKRLAQDHLENNQNAGGSTTASVARRMTGPISRAQYTRYVEDADFQGRVERDSIQLTRPVIPRVIIRDRNALDYLFDCCAYNEAHRDSLKFVEIYDFSRSGFSNGDLMVVHPSGNSYILDGLDVDFLASAAGWDSRDQLRYRTFVRETGYMDDLVSSLEPPAYLEWEAPRPEMTPEEEEDSALRGIWGDLHRAVDKQYGRGVMEMYFARDDSTTTIEFWGYEPDNLNFEYLGSDENKGRHDLMTVSVTDTVVTAHRNYMDLMILKESRVDTVYVRKRD
ncbi:hypothetical protein CSB20_07720 [bacterium DOLZORAL124_64_63]|nr:MAG: hypothetical protein CSB20_07720 [bacterium DOLZORAL124_64_63]